MHWFTGLWIIRQNARKFSTRNGVANGRNREVLNTFHRVFNKLNKAFWEDKLSFGFHNAITEKKQSG
jgi:hypothetical protein